ncbi:hypothetical protein AEQU1_00354 [Aequorivita sp. CIP111184]|nr:hypothetical protein AEQU1_00354 [Aequorivita sp. CIP111184]
MDILKFLGGPGLFLILAVLVIAVVVYQKLKKK